MKSDIQVLTIPNQSSSGSTWVTWHKALRSQFGRKMAESKFKANWETRGNIDAVDNDTENYFAEQGIKLEKSLFNRIKDFPLDVTESISDLFTMPKYVSIVLGVVIIVPLGILLFNIAKSPVEVIKSLKGQ